MCPPGIELALGPRSGSAFILAQTETGEEKPPFGVHRKQLGCGYPADEYRELDEERVLVLIRIGGRGRTSGLDVGELGKEAANLLHIRDGKVTRLVLYWDRDRALADVGLPPGTGSPRA